MICGTALVAGVIPALMWQASQSAKTACQTNLRNLSTALLLYSEDHDGYLPLAERKAADGTWQAWIQVLQPYLDDEDAGVCPSNTAKGCIHPFHGYRYPWSYALNARFHGVFGRGDFPIENVEIGEQTALLVESGAVRLDGPFGNSKYRWALPMYWDTAWWPGAYPSPHRRRMNIAALDGHVTNVEVLHYTSKGHNLLYGRIGRGMYNWNGGHPNGDTTGPPLE